MIWIKKQTINPEVTDYYLEVIGEAYKMQNQEAVSYTHLGELAVANTLEKYFIVRIAWVFGVNGKNFIKTMLNVGKKNMIPFVLSMTRLVHQLIHLTFLGCLWIWQRAKNAVTIMQPMRVVISVGMTSPMRFSSR